MQYWTVRIGVADSWVADGWEGDPERIKRALLGDIAFAYGQEVSVEILKKLHTARAARNR